MRWVTIFFVGFMACGEGKECSPLGTYNLALLWQGGNCNLLVPRSVTFTVTAGAGEAYILSTDNGATIEGFVVQGQECISSLSITEPDGIGLGFLGTARSDYNIVAQQNGDVEGSGMITVGPPENCLQTFLVEGEKLGRSP